MSSGWYTTFSIGSSIGPLGLCNIKTPKSRVKRIIFIFSNFCSKVWTKSIFFFFLFLFLNRWHYSYSSAINKIYNFMKSNEINKIILWYRPVLTALLTGINNYGIHLYDVANF